MLVSYEVDFCSPCHRALCRWLGVALSITVAGCQIAESGQVQTAPSLQPPETGPTPSSAGVLIEAIPRCQAEGSAKLDDGLVVDFKGAALDDPLVCLVSWKGRTYRYFAGFWGSGRYRRGTVEEREAVRRVLLGPVGATATFEDTRASMWGRVTAEHVANPVLALKSGPRRTALLRVVKHDELDRAQVQAERLYWVDAHTGIALKRQVVTRLANGETRFDTTWKVERLDGFAS